MTRDSRSRLVEVTTLGLLAGDLLSASLRDLAAAGLVLALIWERVRGDAVDLRVPARWGLPIGAFLAAPLVSALFSENPAESLQRLAHYPAGVLLCLGAARVTSAGGERRLAIVVLLVLAFFAGDALWQWTTGESFFRPQGPMWGRFLGSLRSPSDLSILAILFPIASLAFVGLARERVFSICFVLPLALAVAVSGSRIAWLSLLGAAGAMAWVHGRVRWALAGAALVVLAGLGAASLGGTTSLQRLTSSETYWSEKRPHQWLGAWTLFRESPLVGHGPHSFRRIVLERHESAPTPFSRIDPDYAPYPHSLYLEALSGTGILGLSTFLWLLAQGLRRLGARGDPSARAAAASLLLFAAVGLVDLSFSKDVTHFAFWIPTGVALGTAVRASRARFPENASVGA